MRCRSLSLVVIFISTALSACSAVDDDGLQAWMTAQRTQAKPHVTPIPEPKKFTPQTYTEEGTIDPFSFLKLSQAFKKDASQSLANAALITPELNRRKEALESMPLDVMSMVGSIVKDGRPMALVKVDNLLYQIRAGNYLGQNYGLVTKVNETEVRLREIVQDASGEWTERPATLQLQERTK